MKTITFDFLLFFLLSTFLILSGCKKENEQGIQYAKTPTAADYEIHRIIEGFKSDLKSHLKVGEELNIDSVIWYIEASLNETYARADYTNELVWIDSAFVDIPLTNNNMVLLSDVKVANDTLIKKLSEHYHAVSGEKSLLLVDITLLFVAEDKITIRMKDYVANRPVPPTPNEWTFGPGDYWYWGLGMGKCTEPGFLGLDAATQITTYANNSLPFGGSTQYFINLSNTGTILPDDVPASSPNPFGYISTLLFFNASDFLPETNDCLEPAAMNYYLNNIKQIAQLPQYNPIGKPVAHYFVESDIANSTEFWMHIHKVTITYGIPTVAIDPPQEP